MRTWVKVTLGSAALVLAAFAALAGTGAYFVLRHMEERPAEEQEAVKAIEAVKARFGTRPPLIEITDARRADIRINRATDASTTPVDTLHVINWKHDRRELTSVDVPLWLMRFSTINIASRLNISPAKLQLTVSDVERYGPGVVVDHGSAGASRLLVWVD